MRYFLYLLIFLMIPYQPLFAQKIDLKFPFKLEPGISRDSTMKVLSLLPDFKIHDENKEKIQVFINTIYGKLTLDFIILGFYKNELYEVSLLLVKNTTTASDHLWDLKYVKRFISDTYKYEVNSDKINEVEYESDLLTNLLYEGSSDSIKIEIVSLYSDGYFISIRYSDSYISAKQIYDEYLNNRKMEEESRDNLK